MRVGSTIRNIAAVPPTETEVQQIGSAVRHAETRFPIARPTPASKLGDRAEISPAIAREEPVQATVPPDRALVTDLAMRASAIGPAEQIAPEAGISLEAVAETAMHLEVVREVRRAITGRARALAAAAVHQVWDPAEAVVEVAEAGVGRWPSCESKI